MKIMLIQPWSANPIIDKIFMQEPLALEYVGAGLVEDGHEVVIHDARIDPDFETSLMSFRPDIVGLTAYTSHLDIVKQIAARVKQIDPRVMTVVGGHHATVQPADFNIPALDVVVRGEGVITMKEIANAVRYRQPMAQISGIALTGDRLIFTSARPYTPLDDLPIPDRALTKKYRRKYFNDWLKPIVSVRTSLGCKDRCSFCALWPITGGKYLRRSPESVIRELKTIRERNIFFCDDESMVDVTRMNLLADRIEQEGIRKNYFLFARVDTIIQNIKLLRKWRRIGLKQVLVGMESYSDERLKMLNKRVTVEQQERAVSILKELGITLYSSLLVDPDFEKQDFEALIRYVKRMDIRYSTFSILTPLPGTQYHNQKKNEIMTQNPALYDLIHTILPTRLSLKEFYLHYSELYRKLMLTIRSIGVLFRYGPARMIPQILLINSVIKRIRNSYLDHEAK